MRARSAIACARDRDPHLDAGRLRRFREEAIGNNLSVRSDGRLTLAPQSSEFFDSSTAYLWALARDSKGNLYAGGGPGAKLFRIAPHGKAEKIADFDALEIHAIAIDSKDRVYAATSPDGKIYRIDSPTAKPEVFYDPKQKYIWAMALRSRRQSFYRHRRPRRDPSRHAGRQRRSLFQERRDPCPLARLRSRWQPDRRHRTRRPGDARLARGEGFVLYQMAKREVTAVAVGRENQVYAAAVGSRNAPEPSPRSLSAQHRRSASRSGPPPPRPSPSSRKSKSRRPPHPPRALPHRPWRLGRLSSSRASGAPERSGPALRTSSIRSRSMPTGHLLIGSGNKGNLYRVEDALALFHARHLPGRSGDGLLPAIGRHALRRHRQCRQGLPCRPGSREGRLRSRAMSSIPAVTPPGDASSPRTNSTAATSRSSSPLRQSGSSAAELERLVPGQPSASPRPPPASCSGKPRSPPRQTAHRPLSIPSTPPICARTSRRASTHRDHAVQLHSRRHQAAHSFRRPPP